MARIKKGDEFLPSISKNELKKLYNSEKNSKAKLRLLSALLRKDGQTLDSIAYSVEMPKTTIHDWLKRFERGDLDQLYDIKQPGKPARLKKAQLVELDNMLSESPQKQDLPFVLWTTKLVQYLILKKFGVEYKVRQIRNLTHTLRFALKVPRQQNRKANKNAQAEFKKKLRQRYNIILNLDSRSSVLTKRTSS